MMLGSPTVGLIQSCIVKPNYSIIVMESLWNQLFKLIKNQNLRSLHQTYIMFIIQLILNNHKLGISVLPCYQWTVALGHQTKCSFIYQSLFFLNFSRKIHAYSIRSQETRKKYQKNSQFIYRSIQFGHTQITTSHIQVFFGLIVIYRLEKCLSLHLDAPTSTLTNIIYPPCDQCIFIIIIIQFITLSTLFPPNPNNQNCLCLKA